MSNYYEKLCAIRLESSSNYSAASDVYSFGVFLLELITGREANSRHQLDQEENIVFQVHKLTCTVIMNTSLVKYGSYG